MSVDLDKGGVPDGGSAAGVAPTLMTASHISKVFGGLVAVNDISFTVPERAIVSLIGPNGAGKTTFFNCLTGLYMPTAGQVIFDGKDITAKRPDIVTNAGIARTFQNIGLFPNLDVVANLRLVDNATFATATANATPAQLGDRKSVV